MLATLLDLASSEDRGGRNLTFLATMAFGFERETHRPAQRFMQRCCEQGLKSAKRFWARAVATLVGYRWRSADHRTGEDRL